jgi:AraC-like DNA-binding protein
MDIYHIGEELFRRQLVAKQLTSLDTWLTLAPNKSALTPVVTAFFENENGCVHRHCNSRPTLLYAFAGTVLVNINGQRLTLTSGNLVFVAAQQTYRVLPLKAGDILTTLLLPMAHDLLTLLPVTDNAQLKLQLSVIQQDYRRWHYVQFNNDKIEDPAYITERILCEVLCPAVFAATRVTHFFDLMVIELLRLDNYLSPRLQRGKRQVTTADLLQYIDQDYDVCTLKTMAQAFHYNPNYLSNRLKSATGQSFIQLVDSRRMEAAMTLLANPHISIDEIVMYIGYSSKSFFYKKFKERYGESPAQRRQAVLTE